MRLWLCLLGLAISGCASSAPTPPTPKITCPHDLSAVKSKLKTPYPELVAFIGEKEMEITMTETIDQMISDNGGIDASITGTTETIKEYKDILADPVGARHDFHIDNKSDQWIDTYMSAVADGITINQAFIDAVECRKAQGGYVPDRKLAPGSPRL